METARGLYSQRVDERQNLAISRLTATDGRRPDSAQTARISTAGGHPEIVLQFVRIYFVPLGEVEENGVLSENNARGQAGDSAILLPGLRGRSRRSADLRRLLGDHLPALRNAAGIFR